MRSIKVVGKALPRIEDTGPRAERIDPELVAMALGAEPLGIPVQDAGSKVPDPLPPGAIVTFHTHGIRQYFGTCKFHRRPD